MIESEANSRGPSLFIDNALMRRIKMIPIPKAIAHRHPTIFHAHLHHARIIAIQDKFPSLLHVLGKRALLTRKLFWRAEKFHMHRYIRDTGQDRDVGRKPSRELSNVTRAISSHLHDEPRGIRCFTHYEPRA